MVNLQDIKDNIGTAEYAAIHFKDAGSEAAFIHYYGRSSGESHLIRDFRAMIGEIESLRHKLFEAEFALEAAGVKIGE